MSSDEYQVLSAPEEVSESLATPIPSTFQVTAVQQHEVTNVHQQEEQEQEQQVDDTNYDQEDEMEQRYEVEPPPPGTPGPSEAPEVLVQQACRDHCDEPLLFVTDETLYNTEVTEKAFNITTKNCGGVKKSALLALLTGVSLAFLTSLLYLGTNRTDNSKNITKPSPMYPQPHPTYFPIATSISKVVRERTSLMIVAKNGIDFLWESKEVFQVRCYLNSWLQWLHQCWNHICEYSVRKEEEEERESDEDVLIVEPLSY